MARAYCRGQCGALRCLLPFVLWMQTSFSVCFSNEMSTWMCPPPQVCSQHREDRLWGWEGADSLQAVEPSLWWVVWLEQPLPETCGTHPVKETRPSGEPLRTGECMYETTFNLIQTLTTHPRIFGSDVECLYVLCQYFMKCQTCLYILCRVFKLIKKFWPAGQIVATIQLRSSQSTKTVSIFNPHENLFAFCSLIPNWLVWLILVAFRVLHG